MPDDPKIDINLSLLAGQSGEDFKSFVSSLQKAQLDLSGTAQSLKSIANTYEKMRQDSEVQAQREAARSTAPQGDTTPVDPITSDAAAASDENAERQAKYTFTDKQQAAAAAALALSQAAQQAAGGHVGPAVGTLKAWRTSRSGTASGGSGGPSNAPGTEDWEDLEPVTASLPEPPKPFRLRNLFTDPRGVFDSYHGGTPGSPDAPSVPAGGTPNVGGSSASNLLNFLPAIATIASSHSANKYYSHLMSNQLSESKTAAEYAGVSTHREEISANVPGLGNVGVSLPFSSPADIAGARRWAEKTWEGFKSPNFGRGDAEQITNNIAALGMNDNQWGTGRSTNNSYNTSAMFDALKKLTQENKAIGLDPEVANILDRATRYGNSSLQEMVDIISQIPESAAAAKVSIQEFTRQSVELSNTLKGVGATNAVAQRASNTFANLTGMSPEVLKSSVENNPLLTQAAMAAAPGILPTSIGQLGGSRLTKLTAQTVTQMMNSLPGIKGATTVDIDPVTGKRVTRKIESDIKARANVLQDQLGMPADVIVKMYKNSQQYGRDADANIAAENYAAAVRSASKSGDAGRVRRLAYGKGQGNEQSIQDAYNIARIGNKDREKIENNARAEAKKIAEQHHMDKPNANIMAEGRRRALEQYLARREGNLNKTPKTQDEADANNFYISLDDEAAKVLKIKRGKNGTSGSGVKVPKNSGTMANDSYGTPGPLKIAPWVQP